MESCIISVALQTGIYLHIRAGRETTLLELHRVITESFQIDSPKRPAFVPRNPKHGEKSIKYSSNNTKTTTAMSAVSIENSGLMRQGGALVYELHEPSLVFICRMIRGLEERTEKPLVVKASGVSTLTLRIAFRNTTNALNSFWMPPADEGLDQARDLYSEWGTVNRYMLAAGNFYGLVPIDIVHQMFCRDHPPIIPEVFIRIGRAISGLGNPCYYLLDEKGRRVTQRMQEGTVKYLADYSIMSTGGFHYMRGQQKGMPFYLPPQEELMRYLDEDYVEQTAAYSDLRKYLISRGMPSMRAEKCMLDLFLRFKYGDSSLGEVAEVLEYHGAKQENPKEFSLVIGLYSSYRANARLSCLCGHTLDEMRAIGGRHLSAPQDGKPLPASFSASSAVTAAPLPGSENRGQPSPARKIGRNNPCPCGSGKKYKHCCSKAGSGQGG